MPFRPVPVTKSITADYTVSGDDHEKYLIAASGADIEFTLPAVADAKNMIFTFLNGQDFEMLITAPDETLVAFNDATADGVSVTTANEHIGGALRVICDGSLYYLMNLNSGAAQTTTVVSA